MRQDKSFQVLFLAYLSLMFLGLSDNIRGPLFPEILAEFSISNTEGSFFFALSSLAGFFGGLCSHPLSRHFGITKTLRLSVFVMLISQIMLSLSPSFVALLVSSLVFGASLGVMGVIANVLVVHALPAGARRNKTLSGLHSVYAGASLLAPVVVTVMASLHFQLSVWRSGFLLTSLLGLIVFVWTFRGPNLSESKEDCEPLLAVQNETTAQIYYAVMVASYVICEILVATRMALYMRREFQASLVESSWYTAGFFICLLIGRLIFTVWAPAIKLKDQMIMSLLLTIACLCVGIYFHPAGLALAGLCMGPFYPMMMVSAGNLFPRSVSQALGWAVAISSLFVVLMHFGVGYVTDLWSLKTAFYLGPAFCSISLGMLIFYEKIFRRLQHTF